MSLAKSGPIRAALPPEAAITLESSKGAADEPKPSPLARQINEQGQLPGKTKIGGNLLEAFDQLNLVAEIAAALLGFIAVFLALSKTDGRFSESDRHFVQALVTTSALAIIFSLAPRSISLFTTDAKAWYAATILAITIGSLNMLLAARQQLRMSRDQAVQIQWVWHWVAWTFAVSGGTLWVLALFDTANIAAYYVGGVSLMIPLCLWVFIGVVFRRFF
jgi:hypothetical protein